MIISDGRCSHLQISAKISKDKNNLSIAGSSDRPSKRNGGLDGISQQIQRCLENRSDIDDDPACRDSFGGAVNCSRGTFKQHITFLFRSWMEISVCCTS